MKLVSLTLENFMPYKGRTSLRFPTDENRNVMLVFGENMRGKTSLLNAIRWGFYGRALGRHLREIPLHELHNKEAARENDWTMEVKIEFEADGHSYELLRRIQKKPLVARPSRREDFVESVGLKKDSVAISANLIDAEINRFAPEQVSRFFLFDGELLQEYEELLIEGSDQGKKIKAAIEQVLGVPTLLNGRSDLSTLLRSAQRQQLRDIAHVKGLESQAQKQEGIQTKLDAHESDLKILLDKLSDIRARRAALDDQLEKVESVHRSKIKLDAKRSQQEETSRWLAEQRRERLLLMRDAWRDVLRPKLEAKRENLRARQDALTASVEAKGRASAQVDDIRKLLQTSSCPTCHQSIDDVLRAKFGAQLGAAEVRLQEVASTIHDLAETTGEIKSIDRLLDRGVEGRIATADRMITKGEIDLTRLENEIEVLSSEIRGHDTAEIARQRVHRDGLLREEGHLAGDIEATRKEIETLAKELAIIDRQLKDMPSARARKSTALVTLISDLEKVFGESIESLRERLRKDVEFRASEAFMHLTTQKTYRGLEINKNYGLSILDSQGEAVTVRSAGAEQIVALSLIDGLARTGRSAGPVIMDTPFGRLDLQHRDNILRYLPTTTSQLILLVHGGEIRRPKDLEPVASRVGASYEIREVSSSHSRIERATT